jgi:hypothetical protein
MMWENGEWSATWQVKGGEPVQGKGFHASIAVREDGVWKKRMVMVNATHPPGRNAVSDDHTKQSIASYWSSRQDENC